MRDGEREERERESFLFTFIIIPLFHTDPARAALSENSCSADAENYLQHFLYVFLLGQVMHGVGGTTLYIVGVALIDDSVPSSASPLYVGR